MYQPLKVLLIANRPADGSNANAICDHIDAFTRYSKHSISVFPHSPLLGEQVDFNYFDVIILHYTASLLFNYHLSDQTKQRLAEFGGLTVVFAQDEFRQVNYLHQQLNRIKADVLFTVIPTPAIEQVYPKERLPKLRKINTLTGFVPEALLAEETPAIKDRPIHVGYRGRKLPFWYGDLAMEKWRIVDGFKPIAEKAGLKTNLSYAEHDRLYGQDWAKFMTSCQAMLGTESGTSVIDFSGQLEQRVERYMLFHPFAQYEQVQNKFFSDLDGKIDIKQISPRCFEAICYKTALVLFECNYSGVMIPDEHFIVLKKDFSNANEVIAKLKQPELLQKMVDKAYQDIALNPKFHMRYFIEQVDKVLDEQPSTRTGSYSEEQFAALVKDSSQANNINNLPFKNRLLYRLSVIWKKLPEPLRRFGRTILLPIIRPR